jgi:hypothetical protein
MPTLKDTIVKFSGPFAVVSREGNSGKIYFVMHVESGLSIAPQTSRKVALKLIDAINEVSKGSEYIWEELGPAGCQELPAEDRLLAFTLAMRARALVSGVAQ